MDRKTTIYGLAGYVVACVLALVLYGGSVEKNLEEKASAALDAAVDSNPEFVDAKIDYTMMRGTLRGLSDPVLAKQLREKVLTSVGAGQLDIRLDPQPLSPPHFELAQGSGPGTWTMSGQLPSSELVSDLVAVFDSSKGVEFSGLKRGRVLNPTWCRSLPELVQGVINQTDQGFLRIGPKGFEIGGNVSNQEKETGLLQLANSAWGSTPIDLLRVPGWIQVESRGEKLIVSGKLGDQSDLERVLDLISAQIGKERLDSKDLLISDDHHLPQWMETASAGLVDLVAGRENGISKLDHQRLTVGGMVVGDEARQRIIASAEGMVPAGVSVEASFQVRTKPSLLVGKMGEEIRVRGLLPKEEMASGVVKSIQDKFPWIIGINREELKVDEMALEPQWLEVMKTAMPDMLEAADSLLLEVKGGDLVVTGSVRSGEAKNKILKLALEVAGEELKVNGNVEVLSAPELTVTMSKAKITLSGKLPEGRKEQLIENFRKYLTTVEIKNNIGTAGTIWEPEWINAAGEAIPEFLQMASELGDARVVIGEKSLLVEGSFPSDELREVVQQLFSPFSRAGLKLDLAIKILPQPRLILRYREGVVQISGRLRNQGVKNKFIRAMKSQFPGSEVEDNVIIDENASDLGWGAFASGLVSEIMRPIGDPGVDLRPGKMRIEGVADLERTRTKIEERLIAEYGGRFEIESAIQLPEDLLEDPRFELSWQDGEWVISGLVSNRDEKEAIEKAAKDAGPKGKVVTRGLDVSDGVRAAPWSMSMGPILLALAKAEDPWLSVQRGEMAVEGIFPDIETKRNLKSAGDKIEGLNFQDWTTLADAGPQLVVPPPPGTNP